MSYVRLETWDCEEPTFKVRLKELNIKMLVHDNPSDCREDVCYVGSRKDLTTLIIEQWQDSDLLDEIEDGDPNQIWFVQGMTPDGARKTVNIEAPTRGIALDKARRLGVWEVHTAELALVGTVWNEDAV